MPGADYTEPGQDCRPLISGPLPAPPQPQAPIAPQAGQNSQPSLRITAVLPHSVQRLPASIGGASLQAGSFIEIARASAGLEQL